MKNDSGQSAATFTVSAGGKYSDLVTIVNFQNKDVTNIPNWSFLDAPEFVEKPHIIQRDGGKVLVIKVKARSKVEPNIEWIKNDQPVKETDRIKFVMKKDEKAPTEYVCMLEIKVTKLHLCGELRLKLFSVSLVGPLKRRRSKIHLHG